MKKPSQNIKIVLAVLRDEIRGDVKSAMKKLDKNYTMTWMYKAPKSRELFPVTGKDVQQELEEAYPIKGRGYNIKNVAEGKNVVMVELVESYPDPKTKKIYRTPLVLVLEMKNGKIKTGRHYCDPRLSYLSLTNSRVAKAFK